MKSRYIPFLLVLLLWLSACGNNGRNPGIGDGDGGGGGGMGVGEGDGYVNAVVAMAAESPEDSEPHDVEALVPTSSDSGEPQGVL
mgnify:CR=1 FL=1